MASYNVVRLLKNTKTKLALSAGSAGLAAALALGGGVGHANPSGPVCNVPADYPTIQAAVDTPSCSTVKVAAGTYSENVNITRSVTVRGAKAGDNVNYRTAAGAQESTVTGVTDTPVFTVNATNVTIDGFTITNPSHGLGVTIKTAGNNTVVKNDIVDSVGSPAYADTSVGVYLENGPDGVRVSDNRISNIQSVKSAQGILIGDSTATDPSLDARVVGNMISGVTSTRGAYGFQANNARFTTVKLLNNTVKNLNGAWDHAFGLEGNTPNAVVRNNAVSGLNGSTADKFAVIFQDNNYFFTADVNRNNLNVGQSAYGIGVDPALVAAFPSLNVNGECNYWGAFNGPGSVGPGYGSHVTAGVDYTPWLRNANLNSRCGDNNNHGDSHDGDNNDYNHHDWFDQDWR